MTHAGLIVGLGNPGKRYARHRHNIGFMALDRLLEQVRQEPGQSVEPKRLLRVPAALWLWSPEAGSAPWGLAQPSTYMNRSGRAVQALCKRFNLAPEQVLIVHDELDLPLGRARFKQGGGLAGHNGLKSVAESLGTRSFTRLRLGIDRPESAASVTEYVLSPFRREEMDRVQAMLDLAVGGLRGFVSGGIEQAMRLVHAS